MAISRKYKAIKTRFNGDPRLKRTTTLIRIDGGVEHHLGEWVGRLTLKRCMELYRRECDMRKLYRYT